MVKNPKWSSLGGDGRPAGCLLCRCLHWVYTCCVFNTRSECKVGCVCVCVCACACVYVNVCVCVHPRLFVSMAAVDQASGTP